MDESRGRDVPLTVTWEIEIVDGELGKELGRHQGEVILRSWRGSLNSGANSATRQHRRRAEGGRFPSAVVPYVGYEPATGQQALAYLHMGP
ncbi:hypothetical protein GCM10009753_31280 [Streptantibioticus ferralitis]